jgi:phosphohistidine phosphatase
MRLLLIRHARAQARRAATSDFERRLTGAGRARFRACVRGLALLGVELEAVLTSPAARARETAALLQPLVRVQRKQAGARTCAELGAAPDRALLTALRAAAPRRGALALVGHEPHLSALAAWLVAGDRALSRGFALKKGGLLALEGALGPGRMRLVGALAPKWLARVGRER